MPTSRRRRPAIPIPESDLEGWDAIPVKQWNVTASQDIYRENGRIARKGNVLVVDKTEDGKVYWRGCQLFEYEYHGLKEVIIFL